MKKVLTALLCGALTLTLAACGGKTPSAPITPISASKDDVYKEPTGGGGTTFIGEPSAADKTEVIATSSAASDYETEDDFGGVSILAYHGEGGKILIPSKIDGKTVVKIDEHAFRAAPVTNVTIPSTVKTVETRAFTDCSSLEFLTVAEGVEVIEGYAFADCEKLTLVTLPDSIAEINSGAFENCPNLMLTYKGRTYTAADVEELYDIF